jgi:hypothetical protein
MFSTDVPAGFTAARSFHPEFGYLCPSAWMRSKVRRVVMMGVAGAAVATSAALAVSVALAPNAPEAMPTLAVAASVQPIDQAADESPAEPAMDRTAERNVSPRPQGSCDDLAVSFLMSQCQLGKPGKSHVTREARASRAANHLAVTTSSGRLDQVSATLPPMAEAPAAAPVVGDDAPVPLPPERPAAPPRKPTKMAQKPATGPERAGKETAVAAPPPELNLFGLFRLSSRSGSGAWAMSW